MLDQLLIINRFFKFTFFVFTVVRIADCCNFVLRQQNTHYICGFTDEEDRE